MKLNFSVFVIASVCLLIFSIMFATSVGSVQVSLDNVFQSVFVCPHRPDNCGVEVLYQKIVWQIRLPRILMALLTGIGLSVTGAILQSITRNPLADPYLFGISSGSALGAVLVIWTVSSSAISITLGALIGGISSVLLMLTLAGRSATQVERLLLSGVAVSFMLGAFTSLVIYYSDPETASALLFWMMGSFANSDWGDLPLPTLTTFIGIALFVVYRRWISAIQAGDEGAFTLGVPVNQLRLAMLIICSIITAVLVAQVGGIGFVGLMIPHICRFIVGSQLHKVLFMCITLGGSFMIWVDVIAHSFLEAQVLPVGIVTSAIGSLFFFVILKTRSRI
ncbi:MAG: iron ABC transporter permease [Kangiellaceae bacterium]|nr:iron ABC transporter permease [Kangiellaceae bacterium]